MLLHVVLLLLVHVVDRITTAMIFQDRSVQEGDTCTLANNRIGMCRKATDCGSSFDTNNLRLCAGQEVLCCDVIRQQCEEAKQISSSPFIEHIKGRASEALVGEFPFVALVEFTEPNLRCAASIISKRFLLTAAHCLNNKVVMRQVRLGTVNASGSDGVTIQIKRVHKHPDYKPRAKQNDIALIELQKDIQMTGEIKPICLYTEMEDISDNTDLTVMGWGEDNNEENSQVLLKGTIQPVIRRECQARFGAQVQLSENQMCALGSQNEAGDATDACQGDSGGPLVLEKDDHCQLVGIVSTGPGCASEHYAGIYTRISKYLDWIVEMGVWNKTRR